MSRAAARDRARRTVEYFNLHHNRISLLDLLQRVRNLLASEFRWSQFATARAGQGVGWKCPPESHYANRWDISGAIFHFAPEEFNNVVRYDALKLLGELAGMPVVFYNDNHTHAQVIALLDRAISAVKAGAL